MYKNNILAKLAFILVSLDSFFVYFGKQVVGTIIPVNLTLPLILILILITKGKKYLVPENHILFGLSLSILGFTAGVIILPEFGMERIFEIISAIMAFIIGYIFIRWSRNTDEVANVMLTIGLIYTATCVIALSHKLPNLFPVIERLWSLNGTLISRPEVTTDQNFQIFYFIPGILLLALPLKKIKLTLVIICFLGSLYSLAELQTRSGVLVFFSIAIMCVFAPIWTKSLGRKKTVVYPIVGILSAAAFLPIILQYADAIILRFTKTDYSTGLGRLHSFLYLFDNIYKLTWWIPHGNSEFLQITGNKPHSNPTGIFLDGGIFALIGWLWLFVAPIYRLSKLFFKRQLDNLTTMLLIGGIAFLTIQLSLNVPLMDQVWLWAGIILGAESRLKNNHIPDRNLEKPVSERTRHSINKGFSSPRLR